VKFYFLILAILAVWRLTHLLQAEDGPWDIVVRLRRVAGNGGAGKVMDCFYCLSLWIAMPFGFLLAERWSERVLLWLALSAGAILLQRVSHKEN
jgi:hypothetical protein